MEKRVLAESIVSQDDVKVPKLQHHIINIVPNEKEYWEKHSVLHYKFYQQLEMLLTKMNILLKETKLFSDQEKLRLHIQNIGNMLSLLSQRQGFHPRDKKFENKELKDLECRITTLLNDWNRYPLRFAKTNAFFLTVMSKGGPLLMELSKGSSLFNFKTFLSSSCVLQGRASLGFTSNQTVTLRYRCELQKENFFIQENNGSLRCIPLEESPQPFASITENIPFEFIFSNYLVLDLDACQDIFRLIPDSSTKFRIRAKFPFQALSEDLLPSQAKEGKKNFELTVRGRNTKIGTLEEKDGTSHVFYCNFLHFVMTIMFQSLKFLALSHVSEGITFKFFCGNEVPYTVYNFYMKEEITKDL